MADWDVPGGHFFTPTGGGGGQGYPATQRFEWDGFVVQVFQRVFFQWHAAVGEVMFVNVLDQVHDLGRDPWLQAVRQTPPPKVWNEAGLFWREIARLRLLVLEPYPALAADYYGVVGDSIQANGLSTSDVVDTGSPLALRCQRVVLQPWKEDVPWALAFASDGRIIVTERPGRLRVVVGGRLQPEPVATLPALHTDEGGLMGLVLAPDFATTGQL